MNRERKQEYNDLGMTVREKLLLMLEAQALCYA